MRLYRKLNHVSPSTYNQEILLTQILEDELRFLYSYDIENRDVEDLIVYQ